MIINTVFGNQNPTTGINLTMSKSQEDNSNNSNDNNNSRVARAVRPVKRVYNLSRVQRSYSLRRGRNSSWQYFNGYISWVSAVNVIQCDVKVHFTVAR